MSLSRRDAEDLAWYFDVGECLGAPPSNYQAMVAAIEASGDGAQPTESQRLSWNLLKPKPTPSSTQLDFVDLMEWLEKSARVRRALSAAETLEPGTVDRLRMVCGSWADDPPELKGLVSLVLSLRRARELWKESKTTRPMILWLARLLRRAQTEMVDRRDLATLKSEALAVREAALARLLAARKAWDARERARHDLAAQARHELEAQGWTLGDDYPNERQ